ncbi:hypothetical protein [Halobacillus karajensis]|uniref:Uncharacterized protein n=1 Tax=Halobacillus karajensis TaxID=195088 RepID=A0A024PAU9_9BACI|nr:hypothetical protein [Halobacillus karajensis]CDQ21371.1 hypothetical protein BN982_03742 [Halobacillus karajensis]CDQ25557.1 hypothetical protein BN983_03909 [Halobacillus karajensis]CDQ25828.1 hypothetical protein BN981_00032 [Halobacillus karajensis]
MNKTMRKIDKWQEVLGKQDLNEELKRVLKEMHMYFGDLDYEINRLKVKALTYEGYLEGSGNGDLIMDEFYLEEDKL